MIRRILFTLPLAAVVLGGMVGCNSDDGNGVPSSVTNEMQALGDAARKAGGDFGKLSEADKQKFISRTGSEDGAKAMVSRMAAGPPNAGPGAPTTPPK